MKGQNVSVRLLLKCKLMTQYPMLPVGIINPYHVNFQNLWWTNLNIFPQVHLGITSAGESCTGFLALNSLWLSYSHHPMTVGQACLRLGLTKVGLGGNGVEETGETEPASWVSHMFFFFFLAAILVGLLMFGICKGMRSFSSIWHPSLLDHYWLS